jgi:Spy/CpxP family protein refolding chaperone
MRMILAASVCLCLLASAVQAATEPAPAAVAQPAAAPAKGGPDDPNRMICKREHVVGSNRPQKICMTAAERQRLKDNADQFMDPTRRTLDNREAIRASQGGIGG